MGSGLRAQGTQHSALSTQGRGQGKSYYVLRSMFNTIKLGLFTGSINTFILTSNKQT